MMNQKAKSVTTVDGRFSCLNIVHTDRNIGIGFTKKNEKKKSGLFIIISSEDGMQAIEINGIMAEKLSKFLEP